VRVVSPVRPPLSSFATRWPNSVAVASRI
jgi:hypothetical protein